MKLTSEQKLRRFFGRYPEISRDFELSELQSVLKKVDKVEANTVITFRQDIKNLVLISAIMKWGKYSNIKILNAYSLLDIYFGHSEDFETVLDLEFPVLCLFLGYGDIPNKLQEDVIIQAFDNQRASNKACWFLYRGNLAVDYPKLFAYFKEKGFYFINVDTYDRTAVKEI